MTLKVQKVRPEAQLPVYAHPGDAGLDIRAALAAQIPSGERVAVATGLALELPQGTVVLVWDKIGRALKQGLKTMAGVIDAGFRGEFLVVLLNTSDQVVKIEPGDKIAQLLIQPVNQVEVEEVTSVADSTRGQGGFGSTGLQ
ncbi:MAG: dUTP diphosphatase [Patescibacteria group bacterium]